MQTVVTRYWKENGTRGNFVLVKSKVKVLLPTRIYKLQKKKDDTFERQSNHLLIGDLEVKRLLNVPRRLALSDFVKLNN